MGTKRIYYYINVVCTQGRIQKCLMEGGHKQKFKLYTVIHLSRTFLLKISISYHDIMICHHVPVRVKRAYGG